jgi:hypothetical protein
MRNFIFLILFIGQFSFVLAQEDSLQDPPAVHGMLLFGTENLYASHLPMFHSPHNYQVILVLAIPDSAWQVYLQNKKDFTETVYTLEPEKFVLPEQIQSFAPFKAHIYRGHFERGGTQIIENVWVKIKSILYFRKFDPLEKSPENYQFFIVGEEKELFAVHYISERPDFDQIFSIQFAHSKIIKSLKKGIFLTNLANQSNRQALEKGNYELLSRGKKKINIQFLQNLYLEFGDLK